MANFEPKPEHKFTFGLWTVGNQGRDPFGSETRPQKTPAELVYLLGETGVYGVNFHDNDLIPIDATPSEADAIKKDFRKALSDTGSGCANGHHKPVWKSSLQRWRIYFQ